VSLNIPIVTTMSAAAASVQGIKAIKNKPLRSAACNYITRRRPSRWRQPALRPGVKTV
jgi:hypothetical protein